MNSKTILLAKRPVGKPGLDSFETINESIPQIKHGEILLKTLFVSVDPYLRGRMKDSKSYIAPFNVNEPISSGLVSVVIESKNENFLTGDVVTGMLKWSDYQVSNGNGLDKVNTNVSPLSVYLGILGMPGLTAYLGLTKIGEPKAGETVVVSGAAGAVGLLVGQIAKIKGCHVVGIAGSDEKVNLLKSEFGFDEAMNYKTTENIHEAIAQACPNGVDVYFDNVGGKISDGVIFNINKFARIVLCGVISTYNATRIPVGPRLQGILLINSALMKGFIINDFAADFPAAINQLTEWYLKGKIKNKETVIEGFDNIPKAFLGLFDGTNTGKMMVKI
ncbi:NADP-dependent oxidoreductase [Draconibacterium sp.]|nr:NADP-dependent oxidoreductase [Draconibacterium sp.]